MYFFFYFRLNKRTPHFVEFVWEVSTARVIVFRLFLRQSSLFIHAVLYIYNEESSSNKETLLLFILLLSIAWKHLIAHLK